MRSTSFGNQIKLFVLFIFSIYLFLQTGFAQDSEYTTSSKKAISAFEQARKDFYHHKNDQSLQRIEKALKYDQFFIEAWILKAENHEALKSTDQAIQSYYTAFQIDSTFYPHIRLAIAELEFTRANYKVSHHFFESFLPYASSERRLDYINGKLRQIEFILYSMAHPVNFNPVNLGDSINSAYDDYIEILSIDESEMYLTRKQPLFPGKDKLIEEDLYQSIRKDSLWAAVKRFELPIDMRGNEGAVSISPDGIYLFFSACNRPDGIGSCDIYISVKNGEKWTKAVNLGPVINSRAWDSQPCFSSDGKTLFYASRRAGGKGKSDIWYSMLNDQGKFCEPINLGDSVNTSGDEFTPFIHPDGQSLYFSSDGHLGMGKTDLFYCRRKEDGSWTKPKNMGYPINTVESEIKLVVTPKGDKAYISTNREDGKGKYDIFCFELDSSMRPQPVSYVKGKVYDVETGNPLAATFELTDLISQEMVVTSFADQTNGEFLLCLPAGKDFGLNVTFPGYLFHSENFSSAKNTLEPIYMDIPLKPIKSGNFIILNNIFFDHNAAILKEESFAELNSVVKLMLKNPKLRLEIGGHTDNSGSEEYNQKLSEQRAISVKVFLIEKGIDSIRVNTKGYGELQPVAPNTTNAGLALNRRTELKVI
ncbi:MAG: PD40 domain-containing protein [Bacteroidales bacterium]|nr:PD40 domain-containing protein [Bacteroidales bacterium]